MERGQAIILPESHALPTSFGLGVSTVLPRVGLQTISGHGCYQCEGQIGGRPEHRTVRLDGAIAIVCTEA